MVLQFEETRLLIIASLNDVLRDIRDIESRLPWHGMLVGRYSMSFCGGDRQVSVEKLRRSLYEKATLPRLFSRLAGQEIAVIVCDLITRLDAVP